jgi:hypothetical protein
MADVPGGPTPPPPPPPPGTTPGSGGLPPRRIGEILTTAFDIYRSNAANLLLIVALVVVPLSFVSALVGRAFAATETTIEIGGRSVTQLEARSFFVVLLAGLVVVAISVIIWAVLEAAILRGAAQATIGDPVDIEASYRWGLRRFGSVLLVAVLVGLTVVVGFLLLIIPGIIFLVFLSVSVPALVIENRRGTEAMKRSWNLVSGSFWHALVVLLVAAIITGIVSSILRLFGGDNWFVGWIFTAIAQIVTAPYTALVAVVLYLDLRARKEALSADMLRSELASNM